MKKLDISRLERLRKMNLKIGYAIALALMLAAFSWTTERPFIEDNFDELPMDDVLVIPPTVQEPAKELPPPDLPESKTITNQIIIESTLPDLLSTELVTEEPALPIENAVVGEPAPQLKPAPQIAIHEQPEGPPPIFKIVEDMPLFGDCTDDQLSKAEKKTCSDKALLTHLMKNLRYPAIARENGIEGLVVIQFVVEKDGQISDAKVVRDIGAGCGQEALRVINAMPAWEPGKQRGRKVRFQYNLPVKFALN
ncbi:MAG: TonB family protein [Saprospiraceae bacterium]